MLWNIYPRNPVRSEGVYACRAFGSLQLSSSICQNEGYLFPAGAIFAMEWGWKLIASRR
jgi:hypothetical protein